MEKDFLNEVLEILKYPLSEQEDIIYRLQKLIQSETLLQLIEKSAALREELKAYTVSSAEKLYESAKKHYSSEEIEAVRKKVAEKLLTKFVTTLRPKE